MSLMKNSEKWHTIFQYSKRYPIEMSEFYLFKFLSFSPYPPRSILVSPGSIGILQQTLVITDLLESLEKLDEIENVKDMFCSVYFHDDFIWYHFMKLLVLQFYGLFFFCSGSYQDSVWFKSALSARNWFEIFEFQYCIAYSSIMLKVNWYYISLNIYSSSDSRIYLNYFKLQIFKGLQASLFVF